MPLPTLVQMHGHAAGSLLHHADVTATEGDSYRMRQSEQEIAARRRKK